MKHRMKAANPGYVMGVGITKKCEECGKAFQLHDPREWCYKAVMKFHGERNPKMRYFCSWNCRCAAERRKVPTRAEKKIAHELGAKTIYDD